MDERRYGRRKIEKVGVNDNVKTDGRSEEMRRKIAKRRRKRKIVSLLFILLILTLGILIFTRTPLFRIENIEIKGNARVSTEDILAAGNFSVGDNIFDFKKGSAEERLLLLPYISKATVVKKYPSKVMISVKEEDEFAALIFGDTIISCDKNGKSIRGITDDEAKELVCVNNLKQGEFKLGEYVKLEDGGQTELLKKCLSIACDYDFENISEIKIDDKYNVEFLIGKNLTVKLGELGNNDDVAYKVSCVKEVIADNPKGVSGTIDARNPEDGVYFSYGDGTHETLLDGDSAEGENAENTVGEEGSEATEEIVEEISE